MNHPLENAPHVLLTLVADEDSGTGEYPNGAYGPFPTKTAAETEGQRLGYYGTSYEVFPLQPTFEAAPQPSGVVIAPTADPVSIVARALELANLVINHTDQAGVDSELGAKAHELYRLITTG